uniref:Putative metal-response element-binding transcription factor 2 n=1 Tax=Culex tarsalis TaxID=7177 RepID=A0A1Q3EX34_CULTA
MSTRDLQFLASNSSSSSSSSSSSLSLSHQYNSTQSTVLANNTLLSSNGSKTVKLEDLTQAKQQIIIHEFLSPNSGPFSNHHHHHQQVLQQDGKGQKLTCSSVNNSSITILTSHQSSDQGAVKPAMVLDRINICINNHFNEPRQLDATTMVAPVVNEKRSSTDLEPDSTTSSLGQLPVTPEKNGGGGGTKFKLQEDVLVEHKDGRFYLGTVIAIGTGQCLVRFNDNTECWSDFRELTKLSSNDADDTPACVVCKRQNADDNVEVCENCGRGYHVKCMDGNFEKNGYWFCRMCTSPNGKRKDIRYVCSGVLSESLDPLTDKSQLPYNIDTLSWDALHRVNQERNYCYCGDDGDWLREMIQCCRCQQWFHGRCIRSLQYPIFLGDRFYFFICSICNHGHEFVRRLEVSWPDLIHLALYNLVARNGKRFYDVTKAIAAYVEDNWKTLQMSEQMSKLSPNARKEIITQTLTNDRIRFKCGSEVKKGATLWTLRISQPPNPPNVLLQPGQIITEHMLTQMSKENRVYRFLPRVALEKSFVNDTVSREKMTGISYCSPLVSEDDVSEISEDTNQDENSSDYDALAGAGTGELPSELNGAAASGVEPQGRLNTCVAIYNGTGKNASSNLSDSLFSSNAKDGFQLFGTSAGSKPHSDAGSIVSSGTGNRRAFKTRPKKTDSEKSFDIYDSSDDTSRNTLDLIIPPPKDFTGRNNPFHQPATTTAAQPAGSGPAGSSAVVAGLGKSNETKDLMQKVGASSVSHLNSNMVNGEMRVARIVKRRLSARDILNGSKSKRRKFRKSSVIGTTLTTIAAPTASIPFAGQSSSLIASLFSPAGDSGGWPSQITINHLLPSSASASSSGSSTPANCSYPTHQPNVAAAAAAMVPQALPSAVTCPTSLQVSSTDQPPVKRNPAHGRRLRQRQERNYAESSRRTSAPTAGCPPAALATAGMLPVSPGKSGVPVGCGSSSASSSASGGTGSSDLHSSLNLYFGAAHRILSGEKFVIKGKRVSLSGRVQYLIEWEGCPAPVM